MHVFQKGPVNTRIYLSFAGFTPGFILSGEKTALVDTGVPATAPALYAAVKDALGAADLDYILLTHSHYDHCGGIPYLKRNMPGVKVVGSPIARDVLRKKEARAFMERMSRDVEDAYEFRKHYPGEDISLDNDLLDIDVVVNDGDTIDLGGGVYADVLDVPGHTRCSIAYVLQPDKAIFSGEAVGEYDGDDAVQAGFLSDYQAYMRSLDRLRGLKAEMLGLPHHGMIIGKAPVQRFFDASKDGAQEFCAAVLEMMVEGKTDAELIEELCRRYYRGVAALQPRGAFVVNLQAMVRVVKRQCSTP